MWSFTFKGESSRDYGITVNRRAPRQSANTRTVLTEIDGRDGAVIEKVGYNTYTMNMQITVQGKDNLHRISSWLKGEGKFTRSDIEGRYLLVKHESEIEFTMISNNLYTSQITFQVMYPKWLKEDSWSRPWGENLLPNGWDSFRAYRSGKNYIENWDYSSPVDELDHFFMYKLKREHTGEGYRFETIEDAWRYLEYNFEGETADKVTIRMKYRSKGEVRARAWVNVEENVGEYLPETDEWEIFEKDVTINNVDGVSRFRFYMKLGEYLEIKWVQVTDTNNQHLVVETTPLRNGLTRVRTWGGEIRQKLQYRTGIVHDGATIYTHTVTLKNNGDDMVYRPWNLTSTDIVIKKGETAELKLRSGKSWTFNLMGGVLTDTNLDFEASTPSLVEGREFPSWEADENPRIVNEGNTSAQPIIKIIKNKEEKLDVVINGTRLIYEFDNSKYIDIDCYTQEVTDDQGLSKARNLKIGYEFPELKPGDNVVQVLSGDATILFRRKDAWK